MTLIDHFNAFQQVSKLRGFSANVRSLYFAILDEFNALRYPSEIVLENTYLQHLSGIRSTSSFSEARNILINAGLIKFKKINSQRQKYALAEPYAKTEVKGWRHSTEIEQKLNRKPSESRLGLLTVLKPTETDGEKEKDADADAPATATEFDAEHFPEKAFTASLNEKAEIVPAPKAFHSVNSKNVLDAWERWGGQKLYGGHIQTLIQLENRYGTEFLLEAIERAGRSDKKGGLSIKYLEGVIEKRGEKLFNPNATVRIGDYDGVDIAPGM